MRLKLFSFFLLSVRPVETRKLLTANEIFQVTFSDYEFTAIPHHFIHAAKYILLALA
jgi:hypothetical protein